MRNFIKILKDLLSIGRTAFPRFTYNQCIISLRVANGESVELRPT